MNPGRRPPSAPGDPPTPPLGRRPLPESLDRLLPERPADGANLGLWLDAFLPRDPLNWTLTANQRTRALGVLAREQPWRSAATRDVLARRHRLPPPSAEHTGPALLRSEARLLGRALPGTGSNTATELALSFDHVLGVPRLAGSGLKGLARVVAESTLDEAPGEDTWQQSEVDLVFGRSGDEEDRKADDRDRVFVDDGTVTGFRAGRVEFLDALPLEGNFSLVLDVLTPHMGAWYRGEVDAPVEWLSPVPVSLLAVSACSFAVDLAVWLPDDPKQRAALVKLVGKTQRALKRGLTELGFGGKTAAGYGWFEVQVPG